MSILLMSRSTTSGPMPASVARVRVQQVMPALAAMGVSAPSEPAELADKVVARVLVPVGAQSVSPPRMAALLPAAPRRFLPMPLMQVLPAVVALGVVVLHSVATVEQVV